MDILAHSVYERSKQGTRENKRIRDGKIERRLEMLFSKVQQVGKGKGKVIIKMFINCKWVDTLWQWSFYILHTHGL
jgi:hypothetical protein